MVIMLKFFNGKSLKFDDINNDAIEDIRFLFNTNINNVKISILGDMQFILSSINDITECSEECVGVYVDDIKIGGVESLSHFHIGDTTIITNISSEPLFDNGVLKDKANNKYFLNIDYYTSRMSL